MNIEFKNVYKEYTTDLVTSVKALNDVNVLIEQGTFVCVLGVSGSGKTTLLHLMGAIDIPSAGIITYDGQDLSKLSDQKRSEFRNKNIGFLFQDYALVPYKSVEDNLRIPLYFSDFRQKEFDRIIDEKLKMVGMSDYKKRKARSLSGGQKQKVALARALICEPQIILCDEPTGALDSASTDEVLRILLDIKSKGTTLVVATHNPIFAKYSDRILNIKDGSISE